MATINVTLPSDGDTIDASDYNVPVNTIVNEINGNLDNSNIDSAAAISGSKLADASVTPAKRSGGFALITHAFANSTGSQSITGIAFKPKAIIVGWGLPSATTASIASNGRAVDGSPIMQSSESIFVDGSSRVTLTSTSNCFVRPNGSGGTTFAAAVTAFNSDGITVNVGTTDATATNRTFQVLFLG
jgi:hypothetical protein